MKNYMICLLAVGLLAVTPAFSQEDLKLTSKDSLVQSSWMLSVGYNFVDDSGDEFKGLFNVNSEWNAVPYPSRISIGRYFKSGLGIEAIASYNKYKKGKIIETSINTEETDYLGLDTRLSYDLNKIIGETGWFDPYVGVGMGYTRASNKGRGTYNAVVGFRTWISDNWGLDFSSTGKWAMKVENGATNHLQHAAGVVYQFRIEKGLTKKGQEKAALIAALEKEKQRVQDSIATADRLREEAILAERMAKEKEEAELAALEKEKLYTENRRKKDIENRIKELGFVYFDLNSSYLNRKSKGVLDAIVLLMEELPTVKLKITSHTDSRGKSKYNYWLSEKRVESTKKYLIGKEISADRLKLEAFGEDKLTNECDDDTYCSEEKHRENRRSEFIVIDF